MRHRLSGYAAPLSVLIWLALTLLLDGLGLVLGFLLVAIATVVQGAALVRRYREDGPRWPH